MKGIIRENPISSSELESTPDLLYTYIDWKSEP